MGGKHSKPTIGTTWDTGQDDELRETESEDAWWERKPNDEQHMADRVNKSQRARDRLVVAAMGSTGAGKSSFV
jgi:hypothetical protein